MYNISQRDPRRQLKRAVNAAYAGLIQTREKLDKAIAIAEALRN